MERAVFNWRHIFIPNAMQFNRAILYDYNILTEFCHRCSQSASAVTLRLEIEIMRKDLLYSTYY